ncbi:DMT family transporter [Candidatus Gottesmanbacteria bacterium]|nr:DMT family transporter [Candidatus Gottesmanbacteria bacterium]
MSSKKSQVSKRTDSSVKTLASLSLVAVAAGYVIMSVATRLLSHGFQPLTQVYLRLFLGLIIASLVFQKNIRPKALLSIPAKDYLPLLLMGVVGYALMVYFITLGALTTTLLSVSVVMATTPFFSFLYSYLVFKKPIKPVLLALSGLTLLGVTFIGAKSFVPALSNFGRGEVYVLIASACLAWFFVGRKMLSSHLNNSEITTVVMGIAAVSAFGLSLASGERLNLASFGNLSVLLGLVIGASFNVLATQFENFAFQHIEAGVGSQMLLLENVFAPIFGFFLYKEILTTPEIVGALLIVGSVFLANKYS